MSEKKKSLSTTQVICVGFMLAILIGTVLLCMPFASASGQWTPFLDALFTATTSVCVTGLVVVDTFSYWSVAGKCIILCLIELGGLGVVAVTTTIMLLIGRRISLRDRLLLEDAFNLGTMDGLVRFLKKVVKGTIIVEGAGALLCCIVFIPQYGLVNGIFKAVFHSVSAFCNAGMDILGGEGFYFFSTNPFILLITELLIVFGGLGFIVWWDVVRVLKLYKSGECRFRNLFYRLTLHSKIVLTATVILISVGALLFFVLEFRNPDTIGNMNLIDKISNSIFQSITLRTAGFSSVSQKGIGEVTLLICFLLMFIGGSPIGTAGGIKTTTASLLYIATVSVVKGQEDAIAFKRRIPLHTIRKALAVTLISFFTTIIMIGALLLTQEGDFLDIVYETISAIATVGLSRDYTGSLNIIGKIIIIIAMFLGRIGPISIAVALNFSRKNQNIVFPKEDVRVG